MKLTASERAEAMYKEGYAQALKDVGEWLESRRFDIYCWEAETVDGFEALKRGEMPKEIE